MSCRPRSTPTRRPPAWRPPPAAPAWAAPRRTWPESVPGTGLTFLSSRLTFHIQVVAKLKNSSPGPDQHPGAEEEHQQGGQDAAQC